MKEKSLKIEVEVPSWNSYDWNSLLDEVKENVFGQLKEQNYTFSEAVVVR
jgi:hypothetical protein